MCSELLWKMGQRTNTVFMCVFIIPCLGFLQAQYCFFQLVCMYVLSIDWILYLITKCLWNARCGATSAGSGDPSFLTSVVGNSRTCRLSSWLGHDIFNSLHWKKKQIWLKIVRTSVCIIQEYVEIHWFPPVYKLLGLLGHIENVHFYYISNL